MLPRAGPQDCSCHRPVRRRSPRLAGWAGLPAPLRSASLCALAAVPLLTPVTASASRLIARLTGCLGCDAVIGSPAFVEFATWLDVGIAWLIFMSSVVSTLSG